VVFITTLICVSCHLLDASYLTSILAHARSRFSLSRAVVAATFLLLFLFTAPSHLYDRMNESSPRTKI